MPNDIFQNEHKELVEIPLLAAEAAHDQGCDDETLFDFLVRTGKAAFREMPLFAGWKRPKRPKPTFTWPRVPPLF